MESGQKQRTKQNKGQKKNPPHLNNLFSTFKPVDVKGVAAKVEEVEEPSGV